MNKKLLFGLASLSLLLILTACRTSSSAPTTADSGKASRRPDYGQPKTPPEIRGLVKSVIGNEATILKIDQFQRGATTTTTSTATDTKTPNLSLGGATGGSGRGGFAGGGGRPQGEPGGVTNSTTDRTAMMDRIKAMSTGEEKVIIPVGIQMLKSDSNSTAKQRTMVEATISDITADKMVTIWLDATVTDKKVASFVMIN